MKKNIIKRQVSVDDNLQELFGFFEDMVIKFKLENDPLYLFSRFLNEFIPTEEDHYWLIMNKPEITMAYNNDLDHNNNGMSGFYVASVEEEVDKQNVIHSFEEVADKLEGLINNLFELENESERQFKRLQGIFSKYDFPIDLEDLIVKFKNVKEDFEKEDKKPTYNPIFNDPLDLLCDNKTIYKSNFDKIIDKKEVKVYMTKSFFTYDNVDYKIVFHIFMEEKYSYKDGYVEFSIIPADMIRKDQIELIKNGEYLTQFKETRLNKNSFDNQRRTRLKRAYQTIKNDPLPTLAVKYIREFN